MAAAAARSSVFKHAVVGFADQIEQTLQRENLKPDDIAWVVPHRANARILTAVSKRVGAGLTFAARLLVWRGFRGTRKPKAALAVTAAEA